MKLMSDFRLDLGVALEDEFTGTVGVSSCPYQLLLHPTMVVMTVRFMVVAMMLSSELGTFKILA